MCHTPPKISDNIITLFYQDFATTVNFTKQTVNLRMTEIIDTCVLNIQYIIIMLNKSMNFAQHIVSPVDIGQAV